MTREEIVAQATPLLERLHKVQREKAVILQELRAVQAQCPHATRVHTPDLDKKCPDCGKRFEVIVP